MPASTWHFLNANDATVEIPDGLAIAPDVRVSGTIVARDAADVGAFECALARAQAQWEAAHPAPTPEEVAERTVFLAAESDATYGGTAQSAYQANADAIEESRTLSAAFEQGVGEEAAAFLGEVAGERIVVKAAPGETREVTIVVAGKPNAVSTAAVDIVATHGSTVGLALVVDGSAQGGHERASAERTGEIVGLTGTTLRVFADEDARVRITRTQTLDDGFADIDDMGLFAHERARIDVRQTVLGGSTTFTGLAGDLRGDAASVNVETRYLGHGNQAHDFNYLLRHHGMRSQCNLNANGVLAGKSSKTLRGTIDLVRGCKGAEGTEQETVLLVDEGVRNVTVPVILCNEDDVAGNHGATIGHIRKEQLFYLESRGLSRRAAEAMFVGAALEQAVVDAPVEEARTAVLRLGEKLVPGFGTLFD